MAAKENATIVLLFHSIHNVLAAERVFKQNKVRHEIVPVPRALSSDCQMALKFMSKDFELVSKWLHDSRVHTMAIYEDRNGQYTKLSLPLRF